MGLVALQAAERSGHHFRMLPRGVGRLVTARAHRIAAGAEQHGLGRAVAFVARVAVALGEHRVNVRLLGRLSRVLVADETRPGGTAVANQMRLIAGMRIVTGGALSLLERAVRMRGLGSRAHGVMTAEAERRNFLGEDQLVRESMPLVADRAVGL